MNKNHFPGDTGSNNNHAIQDILSRGFLYTHTRVSDNTKKILESSSFLYALVELLNEKGLLTIKELEERKKLVAERLLKKFVECGIGIMHQEANQDKYSFEHEKNGECENRIHLCRAKCCRIPFALSMQDVEERIIRWDFGRPYIIAHDSNGYCVHLDQKTYKCTVYDHRPVPCRGFYCKDNEKWQMWLDYEKMLLNPELDKKIEETNGKFYCCPGFG